MCDKLEALEREVELLRELLELKEKLVEVEKALKENKSLQIPYVPYPVYPTYPTYPEPWVTYTDGLGGTGNVTYTSGSSNARRE